MDFLLWIDIVPLIAMGLVRSKLICSSGAGLYLDEELLNFKAS